MSLRWLATLAVLGLLPSSTWAQTIDLAQNTFLGAGVTSSDGFAQTFTAVSETNVGGGFSVYSPGGGGTGFNGVASIALYSGLPGPVTFLASGTAAWSLPIAPVPVDVNAFWAPVGLTVGATYWLTIDLGAQERLNAGIAISSQDPYAGGQLRVRDGAGLPLEYRDFTNADARFRTFTTSTVPEPSTCVLMSAGLLLLGIAARRRRRS